MRKPRLVLVVVLVLIGGATVALLEPNGVVLGWLRGESFFQKRPTSYWRKCLLDTAQASRNNNLHTLATGGAAALPVLEELAKDTEPRVRQDAVMALGQLGAEAGSAVPTLTKALDDTDADVRHAAVDSLVRLGPVVAAAAIPDLTRRLQSDDPLPALKILRRFCAAAEKAKQPAVVKELAGAMIVPVVALLEHATAQVRWESAETLAALGAAAGEAVAPLTARLGDAEPKVRERALLALGRIGPAAKSALPAIRAALDDKDKGVQRDANWALEQIEPKPQTPK